MRPRITNAGYSQQILAMDGTGINFSKISIGNGAVPQQYRLLTGLVNPVVGGDVAIDSIEVHDDYAVLSGIFSNIDVDAGFEWTEVGIFCTNPESTQENPLPDILYAYGHYMLDGEEEGSGYIPASGREAFEINLTYRIYVGELDNITATVSDSLNYATKLEFREHVNESNPHHTTASDVGLGNVPNVATNYQRPTFEADTSGALFNINSGETLSTMLRKIKTAIYHYISHQANNIKHLTSEERTLWNSKSDSGHKHEATDITSGILPVERGGTGIGGTGSNVDGKYTNDILRRVQSKSVPTYVLGSYTGNGNLEYERTFGNFSYTPKAIFVTRENAQSLDLERGAGFFAIRGTTRIHSLIITWNTYNVQILSSGSRPGVDDIYGYNVNGDKYFYIIFF